MLKDSLDIDGIFYLLILIIVLINVFKSTVKLALDIPIYCIYYFFSIIDFLVSACMCNNSIN